MTTRQASPSAPTSLHVIAGAGQIGPMIAERLLARGHRVRLVRRGAFTGTPAGAETVSASLSDPAAAAEAMRGASVVYHCANPRYHRWPEELVPLARGIAEGAARNGARLVALDNLCPKRAGMRTRPTRLWLRQHRGAQRSAQTIAAAWLR